LRAQDGDLCCFGRGGRGNGRSRLAESTLKVDSGVTGLWARRFGHRFAHVDRRHGLARSGSSPTLTCGPERPERRTARADDLPYVIYMPRQSLRRTERRTWADRSSELHKPPGSSRKFRACWIRLVDHQGRTIYRPNREMSQFPGGSNASNSCCRLCCATASR